MATITKDTNGTFSVFPQGDNQITLATENTYLDKNIVFNIEGGSGAEVIVDNSSPTSSTKLVIDPEITSVEVLTKEDLAWHTELGLYSHPEFTQQQVRLNFKYRPIDKMACVDAQLVVKPEIWNLRDGGHPLVRVPEGFYPTHFVPITVFLSNQDMCIYGILGTDGWVWIIKNATDASAFDWYNVHFFYVYE